MTNNRGKLKCPMLCATPRAYPNNKCPVDLLEPPWDPKTLAFWLPRFACETLNTSGGHYPATTMYSLLSGLLHCIRATGTLPTLWMQDPQFREMHTIIDTYFRELREIGVGAEIKQTNVIKKTCCWKKVCKGLTRLSHYFEQFFFTIMANPLPGYVSPSIPQSS